jgi:pyruvyltransferase
MIPRQYRGAIRTAYFLRIPNVGDRINTSVITGLTGADTQFVNRLDQPHLMAIGSILAGATPLSRIWGSGVMHPDLGVGGADGANVHALRGQLSYSTLQASGTTLADVPLGDPGYLAPSLMGVARTSAPRFRVGLVCHYVDRTNPILQRMMKEDGVADLNVHDAPETFLRRMAECETVISTSLH